MKTLENKRKHAVDASRFYSLLGELFGRISSLRNQKKQANTQFELLEHIKNTTFIKPNCHN